MENRYQFTSRYIEFFLNSVGIFIKSKNLFSRIYGKFLLISIVTCWFGQLTYIATEDVTVKSFIELAITFIHTSFIAAIHLLLNRKKSHLFKILQLLENNFERSAGTGNSDKLFQLFFWKYGLHVFAIYMGVLISPFLTFYFKAGKMGEFTTLIFLTWYPWTVNTSLKYHITYLIQFINSGPISIPLIGNIIFMVYGIIEIRQQTSAFRNLIKDLDEFHNKSNTDDELLKQIKMIIKKYQVFKQFVDNFTECFSWIFWWYLLYFTVNISIIGYAMLAVDDNSVLLVRHICEFIFCLLYLLSFCVLGEVILIVNKSIREEIYGIQWYDKSKAVQKLILMFLRSIHKDLYLKSGQYSNFATFQLYAKVLKASYSYLSILKNMLQ